MTENEMVGWSVDMNLSKFRELVMTGRPGVQQSMELQKVRHD